MICGNACRILYKYDKAYMSTGCLWKTGVFGWWGQEPKSRFRWSGENLGTLERRWRILTNPKQLSKGCFCHLIMHLFTDANTQSAGSTRGGCLIPCRFHLHIKSAILANIQNDRELGQTPGGLRGTCPLSSAIQEQTYTPNINRTTFDHCFFRRWKLSLWASNF